VVVDDLGDLDLGGAGDGLGELVVVDEDEAGLDRLDEVGLGEDAEDAALVVDDRVGGAGEGGDLAAGFGDSGGGVEGGGLAVDKVVDLGCGADDPGVVEESSGLTRRETPFSRASWTTSSSIGRLPEMTRRRTPCWMDFCWMSQRSPTMMMV
jgi:hypothetical protein